MELNVRKGLDRFVAPGEYKTLEGRLARRSRDLDAVSAVVLSVFDRRTRMLPFLFYDSWMFPAAARVIAGALHQAGVHRTRAVFELWNPSFRPSSARIDGKPPAMLLVSSLQIHAERAYAAIRDAWSLGADRPLIIAGGPKATYEPYDFWSMKGQPTVAPDIAVTGEAYVLLELLDALLEQRGSSETMRQAFERARLRGSLESIPGLVYLAPEASLEDPLLIDTGLQRLVQDLDELPSAATTLGLLEPPHRGRGLSAKPLPDDKVARHARVVSLQLTQGCKFNCGYCPIPALNQKSWRFRSPEGVVEDIRRIHERFGVKYFFGTDDNFFNSRQTAEQLLTAMAGASANGYPFGSCIRFATEATELDTYKNRDLLPLARAGGLHAIWFGIEDLTATLVKKGQKPDMTAELFRLMRELKISPMAMLMFHDGQPFSGSAYSLAGQVDFLRRAGAVSMQCTIHGPANGTREYESVYGSGRVLRRVGNQPISDRMFDGNHVLITGEEAPWKRQLELLGGYAAFYNPLNFVRSLERDGSKLRRRRIGYQAVGMVATAWTAMKMAPYAIRLMAGSLQHHAAPPSAAPVPVRYPTGSLRRFAA